MNDKIRATDVRGGQVVGLLEHGILVARTVANVIDLPAGRQILRDTPFAERHTVAVDFTVGPPVIVSATYWFRLVAR